MSTKKPNWNQVKSALNKFSKTDTLSLFKDLYQLSDDNKHFLLSRLALVQSSQNLYKKKIRDAFDPDIMEHEDIDLDKAENTLNEYSKAVNNPECLADLMVYYVEWGNKYTLQYGDVFEEFYDSLIDVYGKAAKNILQLKKTKQSVYRKRMKKILDSADGIGWDYHDGLGDIYFESFGEG